MQEIAGNLNEKSKPEQLSVGNSHLKILGKSSLSLICSDKHGHCVYVSLEKWFFQIPYDLACGDCKINTHLSGIYLFFASFLLRKDVTWKGMLIHKPFYDY